MTARLGAALEAVLASRAAARGRVADLRAGDDDDAITLSATPAASGAKPLSKSAFTGKSVAATISCRWASAVSRETAPSLRPRDQAKPELVLASALNPRLCR